MTVDQPTAPWSAPAAGVAMLPDEVPRADPGALPDDAPLAATTGSAVVPPAEPEPYESFFARMLPRLVAAGMRMLPRAEAEDVAVEALARAYVDWDRLGSLAHRDYWALRVAANLAYDQLRDETRRRRRALPAPGPQAPDDQVELRRSLVPSLRRLPRRQREVLVLGYLVGMTHGEIAAALGCSVGSVKVHLHRGLARLRADLGEGWNLEA